MGDKDKSQIKFELKAADMEEGMLKKAEDTILHAFITYTKEKDMAHHIKTTFDRDYDPIWNCIVGKAFGSYVVHKTNRYLFAQIDEQCILLWKTG